MVVIKIEKDNGLNWNIHRYLGSFHYTVYWTIIIIWISLMLLVDWTHVLISHFSISTSWLSHLLSFISVEYTDSSPIPRWFWRIQNRCFYSACIFSIWFSFYTWTEQIYFCDRTIEQNISLDVFDENFEANGVADM